MEKKLEYLTETIITPFIRDNYPNWELFIKEYFKYLDNGFFNKIINITDNNNPFKIYSEILNDYLEMYFNGIINTDQYKLTNDNKKLFISLSKFISGMKGNKKVFDLLFKSLTNFQIPSEDGTVEIDKIAVDYNESESWWNIGEYRYYDGTYDYDDQIVYNSYQGKPYTYQFITDQAYSVVKDLIESVHPAGFIYEFLFKYAFTDDISISDSVNMSVNILPTYSNNKTEYFYDGSIFYAGYKIEEFTF